MKVLVLSDGEFTTKEIGNNLEDLQNIVGGYIEIPFLSQKFLEHDIDIIINEEGKFIDELTPEILNELIEKIAIHQTQKINGKNTIKIFGKTTMFVLSLFRRTTPLCI